jgi:circadian clock protein KaiB
VPVDQVHFTLFIAGPSPRSRAAEANLRALCAQRLPGVAAVTVVDVTADVAAAEAWRILTTPTVVKHHPPPARRVTGDLSDPERLWTLLDIDRETA